MDDPNKAGEKAGIAVAWTVAFCLIALLVAGTIAAIRAIV